MGEADVRQVGASAARPRFLVDHMLGKLGRYLRVLGYDVEEEPGLSTAALVLCADAEGRVFLTRNRRLVHEHVPHRWLLIEDDDPVRQLSATIDAFGLDPYARLFSRCIRCNVELDELPRDAVPSSVPARVRERYRRFYACPECGTVFWKGTHVRNTCAKLGLDPPAARADA
jgi:uncharacterized protein with PIN domain